ncbi:FAD-dependent oxidoreductase [Rhabdothermincola salaria]|uniref:FAD-dependent oxidoreductase n=1 Tax=Rhabdothermincola salaria TaxID=2903142 RepID=UPI001E5C56D7|nr:FAD-dependent oxidoreductase [Rhabdothermincola salaria]MCD9624303.1 FAD-dependent oxidoreductase [Rhabdothermincola salaria]
MDAGTWDRIVDVVVVGTGGAALTAATLAHDGGADVLLVEKNPMLGGTTAVSGGGVWLPGNHVMAEAGVDDSREEALAYIRRVAGPRVPDPELLEVYVDTAPEVLRYLEDHTPLSTHIQPLPDYYWPWQFPGTKMMPGRTVEADPYPVGEELPEWADRIVKRGTLMSLGAATTLAEDLSPQTPELEEELRRREARDIRPKGAALIARLFKGLLERGVETLLETPARQLVTDDAGDVIGVVVDHDGAPMRIGARKGVVLACGGFEWNPALVRAHVGYDVHPLSPGGNTGDGLLMAMGAGAQLGNMDSYWGTPVMFDPEITRDGAQVPQFEWGRGAPASIVVNRKGRRFANEALPYNDFPKAFGAYDPESVEFPNAGPGYQIFDRTVRDAQRILSMMPGEPDPDWVVKADTIRELAEELGLDPDALEATVERYNTHAAEGVDPDFGRHQHGLMSPGRVKPLTEAPFYAVEIHPGALGTNGGPRLDRHGRVLRNGSGVVGGLYAAGNTAANVFGWAYPSGGGTLGNGLVFGFLAGRDVASRPARDL